MNSSANSNIFESASCAVWEAYGAHVSGERNAFACAVSGRMLSDQAKRAIASSMERLGYGKEVAFATLREAGEASAANADGRSTNAGEPNASAQETDATGNPAATNPAAGFPDAGLPNAGLPDAAPLDDTPASAAPLDAAPPTAALGAADIFQLVEGIDPIIVIAADEEAASALSGAYRQAVPLDSHLRLFGRHCVAFRSFERMLETERGKQLAWALLKKFPKRD